MPNTFAETPDGKLMIASGFDPVITWDGMATSAIPAGVPAPTQAPALSGTGSGSLAGTYTVYQRWLDKDGNVSNLSPVSGAWAGQGQSQSKTISDVGVLTNPTEIQTITITNHEPYGDVVFTFPTAALSTLTSAAGTQQLFLYTGPGGMFPINISQRDFPVPTGSVIVFCAGHGLITGQKVVLSGVEGFDAANGVFTVTVLDAEKFAIDEARGSGGNYTGGGSFFIASDTLVYTNVQAPTDPKVVRRQLLRNTDGEAATYYVDVDTTDLTSTTFSSTRTDDDLSAQTAVPLFDNQGNVLANAHGTPVSHKQVIVQHLGRMFLGVEEDYKDGSVQVQFGSATVQGIGTHFQSSFINRYLYVTGASAAYQITAVDEANQTLTLSANYASTTDLFAVYAIRPAPAERRLVYYSEANDPQAWSPVNTISVSEDSDEITGLMVKGSFLYILERRHIYRFTFQANPADDGYVFLASLRGCVNQRCWALVEDTAYLLDEQGVHAFTGSMDATPVSTPVQEIFRPDGNSAFRINWAAAKWFHCAHFPVQETLRWFVTLAGSSLPQHALCYNYRRKAWWLEEFTVPVGASCTGYLDSGQEQVYLGSSGRRILAFWNGNLDGADPGQGSVRGTATASTLLSLTDQLASFASNLAGAPVVIVSGTGQGQTRTIAAATATALTLTQPWLVQPDSTSVYQVGGISWQWQSGWYRFVPDEETNTRRLEVVFDPVAHPATADIDLFVDFSTTPYAWASTYTSAEGSGVATTAGTVSLVADLTRQTGFVQNRFDSHKELFIDGPRYVSIQLSGVSNQDRIAINKITLDGATS